MTAGRAFTVAELRTVTPVRVKRGRPVRVYPGENPGLVALLGRRGYRALLAAHRRMLKEAGLPPATPLADVNVRWTFQP